MSKIAPAAGIDIMSTCQIWQQAGKPACCPSGSQTPHSMLLAAMQLASRRVSLACVLAQQFTAAWWQRAGMPLTVRRRVDTGTGA